MRVLGNTKPSNLARATANAEVTIVSFITSTDTVAFVTPSK